MPLVVDAAGHGDVDVRRVVASRGGVDGAVTLAACGAAGCTPPGVPDWPVTGAAGAAHRRRSRSPALRDRVAAQHDALRREREGQSRWATSKARARGRRPPADEKTTTVVGARFDPSATKSIGVEPRRTERRGAHRATKRSRRTPGRGGCRRRSPGGTTSGVAPCSVTVVVRPSLRTSSAPNCGCKTVSPASATGLT